ncbi:hypothetical protein WJX72_004470 [[Myrmecia] bisecta]|uniref:Signal recognition particle subunit SRP68 n=1 Tax=[Myrmecia] bisecta TaxID=41462 RepID=A0AAW1Q0V3_9CHLO
MEDAEAGPSNGAVEEQEQAPLPLLSLGLLQSVRSAQAQHGLRHNDYARYRQYCTRRLRKTYKTVKFLHGRGKYIRKKLEPGMVTDVRYLEIPLVNAERAWAYAMELKNQVEEKPDPRKRLHLIRRLAKAARWAGELARVAAQRCDVRTCLEAEAYLAWMSGNVLLEKEVDWETALAKYLRAQKLYEELGKVGSFDQASVCRQQLEEIEPTIRFCKYQISRKGGAPPDPHALLDLAAKDGPGMDQLHLKLSSLAKESQAQAAPGVLSMTWRGSSYPVRNERARVSLHQALDLAHQLDNAMDTGDLEQRLSLSDKMINAFNEAKGSIRSTLSSAPNAADNSDAARADLQALNVAVTGTLLERTITRNLLLVASAKARLGKGAQKAASSAGSKGKDKDRPARPEDVVRLYDSLLSNVKDLGELAVELGGAAGEQLMDECAAQAAQFQAARCLYVAHSFLAAEKYLEAYALCQRAMERAEGAAKKHQECAKADQAALDDLEALRSQALAFRCVAHAEWFAEQQRAKDGVADGMGAISLAGQAAEPQPEAAAYLLDNLTRWESFAGVSGKDAKIFPVPAPLQALPVRPFMLDSALNCIQQPSLDHRLAKEEKKSTFSRLFSWK